MFKGGRLKQEHPTLPPDACIAYFCAEYGLNDTLPIYSGGLGVLAGDILQEAAEQKLPFVAVGLFYQRGFFHQLVDTTGQHEQPEDINPVKVPLELAVDEAGETVLIEVPVQDRVVFAQIWKYQVGNVPLFLLDTNHWKNSPADRGITDQLYGGDQTKRVMQELVLGIGGLRALQRLGIEPTLYHMNEGHSAFLSLELTRCFMEKGLAKEAALAAAHKLLRFTNHTLVPAGNDAFSAELITTLLGKYAFTSKLTIEKVLELGATEEPKTFSMAMLAMRMSERSNAVSKIHAKNAKKLWPDHPLVAVTNGVFLPGWLASDWQKLFKHELPEWRAHMANPGYWKKIHRLSPAKVWETHQTLKKKMLKEVAARTGVQLDENALTVVWARRFTAYKRPNLFFNDIEKLKKLIFSSDKPIQIIVAGKAHPHDEEGIKMLAHIEYLSTYDLKKRVVFVNDYSITLAQYLVAGADVWLNTPMFGLEASGTSGMKSAANGVIQCTTPDGWAWEVDWYGLGYTLPLEKAEERIYTLFEHKIIPAFYKRDTEGIPRLWTTMMKETIATIAPRFSATRMVHEYISKMYL